MDTSESKPNDNSYDQDDFKKLLRRLLVKFWWLQLNYMTYGLAVILTTYLVSEWLLQKYNIESTTFIEIISLPIHGLSLTFATLAYSRHVRMPRRSVGKQIKLMVEFLTLACAVTLRLYLPYDGSNFTKFVMLILVALTLYLHSWGQILFRTCDIGVCDVLMQVLMEVGTYTTGDITCILLILFFVGVKIFRYRSCSTIVSPEDTKKDLEYSPC